ncbi:epoxide hydrolase A-like [Lolium rigidum]|uniref:epoxide hydrolase A-like n=1 Tax=Lolium rigidum TaxID=89674 RepID=UPI001F5D07F1|nr:epoxide hydrolase A-like [Lolium rigidum]
MTGLYPPFSQPEALPPKLLFTIMDGRMQHPHNSAIHLPQLLALSRQKLVDTQTRATNPASKTCIHGCSHKSPRRLPDNQKEQKSAPSAPRPATEIFAALGDGFYITQFQEPGRAEKAFTRYDVATVLKKFYSIELDSITAPPGVEIIDLLEASSSSPLPWMTDEELGQYAEKFQKSGFTGPLNYYRMMDMNWRLTAPWHGAKIMVPAKFIAGDKDTGFESFGTKHYVESGGLKSNVPDLEVAIIEGHHYLQQEQAQRVNTEILSFLDKFSEN